MRGKGLIILGFLAVFLSVNGCSTLTTEKEMSRIPYMLAVRNEPAVSIKTNVALTGSNGAAYESRARRTNIQTNVADMIVDEFTGQIRKEVPYWPKMQKSETPLRNPIVNGRAVGDGEHYIMGFDVSYIFLSEGGADLSPNGGFCVEVYGVATIVDPMGKLVFLQNFYYDSREHKRSIPYNRDVESRETGRYLEEEAKFAAKIIVSGLVDKFKNGPVAMFNGAI